ncbi:MAG: methylated-DNA--[protein]-cysteine S-methyltransferase [Candidatus Marinimicrobia bacterium]|nr:methylated-DNA--[protein]-cysteine S-methyltransferase [Candidatus Neomarinimicrobiota bacterium]MBL7010179.1 methylated-DNA--[protein]-cysteine S-methyltransferase [Candidatus Neomarinimicrobiota bacterium]MBL7030592.1 methylated-DNA--[protein]-cysteine S-methyltransferase [Candidatus Neomarinimicrobiota bacterium]
MIQTTIMDSPIGKLLLAQSNIGLTHILFEYEIPNSESIIRKKFPKKIIVRNDKVLSHAVQQINEYFSGKRQSFDLGLDLRMPPFHYKALLAVKGIPYGKTQSYKNIAKSAGNPKAVRAAGSANANNPLPILIPCHRVLSSGGGLGGYGGGLKMKNYLLNLEGAL